MRAKKQYIHELWQQFTNQLIGEWPQKYQGRFGEFQGFERIEKPYLFARAVHKEINRYFAEKGVRGISIVSEGTLNHAFQRGGLSDNTKDKSLDTFAVYLGFKDWLDFQSQEDILPETDQTTPTNRPVEETTQPIAAKRRRRKLLVFFVSSLLLLFLIYVIYYFRTASQLKQIIHDANQAEFNLYASFPKVDTTFFDLYYTKRPDHYNRLQIAYWLGQRAEKPAKLDIPPSHFEVLEYHIDHIGWKAAHMETKEIWCISWKGDIDKYDVTNLQQYYFIYQNGKWLIDANSYEGTRTPKSGPTQ